jgi:hypothetical protein
VGPNTPDVLQSASVANGVFVYDAQMQTNVLFGGGITDFAYGDTWVFSHAQGWSPLSPFLRRHVRGRASLTIRRP